MYKRNAGQLRHEPVNEEEKSKLKKNPIYIICDNILDTYNTGSIFRLADAVAATKVYLCGVTETPPNTRIKKASINTTEWVDWEYCTTTKEAIEKVRQEVLGVQVVVIEQDEKSVPFDKAMYQTPVAFVACNESTGATPDVLEAADLIVEMPMFGVNVSLNVMVSLGIVLYMAVSKLEF